MNRTETPVWRNEYKNFKMLKKKILQLLWPEVCPFCQKAWKMGPCPTCKKEIQKLIIKEPRCMQCGKPVGRAEQEYCHDCMHAVHHFDKGLSLWLHKQPVSGSVYQFKYHNQRVYGKFYANELVRQFGKQIHTWNPGLIIPIPLHIRRKRKRGYNQAEIVARELGSLLRIPVDVKSVKRRYHTRPQKELKHSERKENLKNAFQLSEQFIPTGNILLIDDIYTTGNTIDAAAQLLKKAGAANIYFLTISIGQGY